MSLSCLFWRGLDGRRWNLGMVDERVPGLQFLKLTFQLLKITSSWHQYKPIYGVHTLSRVVSPLRYRHITISERIPTAARLLRNLATLTRLFARTANFLGVASLAAAQFGQGCSHTSRTKGDDVTLQVGVSASSPVSSRPWSRLPTSDNVLKMS